MLQFPLERQPSAPGPFLSPNQIDVLIPEAPVRRQVRVQGQTKLRAVRIYTAEFGDLVASIELLSPVNKQAGSGLGRYRRKRRQILDSPVHLIELDLLRGGQRPGIEVLEPPLETNYVLLVNRGQDSDVRTSEIWPVALNQPLPLLPIPLLPADPDVALDLQVALNNIYERARYVWRINYNQSVPSPELRPTMATWLKEYDLEQQL